MLLVSGLRSDTKLYKTHCLTVVAFLQEKLVPHFGAPNTVVRDNAACFTAQPVQSIMKECGTQRKTVLAYAAISNGRPERMVGTLKRSVARLVVAGGKGWDAAASLVVFWYCQRSLRGDSAFLSFRTA